MKTAAFRRLGRLSDLLRARRVFVVTTFALVLLGSACPVAASAATLYAVPAANVIAGDDFAPNATVQVHRENAPGDVTTWQEDLGLHSDATGHIEHQVGGRPGGWRVLQPGQTITAADGVTTRTLVVTRLRTSGADADEDVVWGTAAPGSLVTVTVDGSSEAVVDTTDSDGLWEADFSGSVDVTSGTTGEARQEDADGDFTQAEFWAGAPTFAVYMDRENLGGDDWMPSDTLYWVPGSSYDALYNQEVTDSGGSFYDQWPMIGFFPGNRLTVTDGWFTKEMVFPDVSIDGLSATSDTVSGHADAGSVVWVTVDGAPSVVVSATANGAGTWRADLAPYDLLPGATGSAMQLSPDSDAAVWDWAANASALSLTGPGSPIKYGAGGTLGGKLVCGGGASASGVSVQLETASGVGWQPVSGAVAPTASDGSFQFWVTPRSRTSYRVSIPGGAQMNAATSPPASVDVYASVGAPKFPKRVRPNRRVTATGSIAPAHSGPVKIEVYRQVRRKWRLYKRFTGTSASSGAYRVSVKLPRGTYRVRAVHADASHVTSVSRYVSLRVR